jgi:mRNA-degrading endonuclease RelE of RelBE toxin-antitoxin system
MTAPLPLRFYNPVKSLCEKVNLDYETVIGTGLSPAMREVYLTADIAKELKDITKKDMKLVKEKVELLNSKYGTTPNGSTGTGETQDKGRIRYDAELIVEPVLSDNSEVDKSNTIRYGMENTKAIHYERTGLLWSPGKGVIPRSELGMD